jgi:hypothetical protein
VISLTQEENQRLAELRVAFDADRADRDYLASELGDPPPSTCRYCRRYRRDMPGAGIDGHAQCLVSAEFKRLLSELLRSNGRISFQHVGEAIGVTKQTVRYWYWNDDKSRTKEGSR